MSESSKSTRHKLSLIDQEILDLIEQLNREYMRYLDVTSVELAQLVADAVKPLPTQTTTANSLAIRTTPDALLERFAQ